MTAWLDEALVTPLDKRSRVLGCLKDLASIDQMLLGDDKAIDKIEDIQVGGGEDASRVAAARGRK